METVKNEITCKLWVVCTETSRAATRGGDQILASPVAVRVLAVVCLLAGLVVPVLVQVTDRRRPINSID